MAQALSRLMMMVRMGVVDLMGMGVSCCLGRFSGGSLLGNTPGWDRPSARCHNNRPTAREATISHTFESPTQRDSPAKQHH